MRLSRALAAVVLLSILTACGGPPAAAPAPTSAPAAQPAAASTSAPAPTAAPAAAAPTDATATTRTVKHAMGSSEVPLHPQRVVTLDMGELDAALTLGIKPVGSVTTYEDGVFPSYLKGKTDGIAVVGTIAAPNLEKILALKPDLILSSKTRDEERYDLLSKIAPTVFVERLGDAWLDNFKLFAEALGKQQEGQALITAYEQRLTDLHTQLGPQADTLKVSIVRFVEGGQTRTYHPGSFIGTILAGAKFQRPAGQQQADKVWVESNKELIGDLDGDVIFYGVYGDPAKSPLTEYTNDPLWTKLSAVQKQRVFQVDDEYWFVAIGITAANRVIDDLESRLLAKPAGRALTIKHEGGELTFTAVPQRVVVLEYSYADALFGLGVEPIAYADDGVPAYILKRLKATSAQPVGTRNEPNLETLSTLHADLIIADTSRHSKIYAQLSQIAPTLMFDSYRGSFETQITIFETLSTIFHKEDAAKAEVAAVRKELDEARQLASGHKRSLAIGVLAPTGFTAHSNTSFKGSLLAELGLPTALEPKGGSETQFLIDLEGIVTLKPAGVVITCAPEDRALLDKWVSQPVWQQLDAVKAQQVYVFNRDLWSKSRGVLALHLVLRDARESGLLTGEPSRSTTCPDAVEE